MTEDEQRGYEAYGYETDDGRATQKRGSAIRQTRLSLVQGTGEKLLVQYALIRHVACTSHQHVSLICSDRIYTLHGQGLGGDFYEGLQDEKVRWALVFHKGWGPMPEEGVVIRQIETGLLLEESREEGEKVRES